MSTPSAPGAVIRDHLTALVGEHGQALCLDHRRVERLLLDAFPKRPREAILLHVATREGIAADLARDTRPEVPRLLFDRLVQRLRAQAGLTPRASSWAVQAWAAALGRTTPPIRLHQPGAPIHHAINPHPTLRAGHSPRILQGHRRTVSGLSFSLDGKQLATVSFDRTLRLWDTAKGIERHRLYGGHRDWIHAVSISPDGRYIVTGGEDGRVRLWDARTHARLQQLAHHAGAVQTVAFSPDGRLIASGSQDGSLSIWDIETFQPIGRPAQYATPIQRCRFSPHGQWIALTVQQGVEVIHTAELRLHRRFPAEGEHVAMDCGPDGLLLIADQDRVALYSIDKNKTLQEYPGHDGPVVQVAIHPNGQTIATGGQDRSLRVWHTRSAQQTWRFDTGSPITDLSFSNGHLLGIAYTNGNAALCRMTHAQE